MALYDGNLRDFDPQNRSRDDDEGCSPSLDAMGPPTDTSPVFGHVKSTLLAHWPAVSAGWHKLYKDFTVAHFWTDTSAMHARLRISHILISHPHPHTA